VKKGLSVKDKNRDKLLKYLGNPDNEWPDRTFLAREVLGYKSSGSLWKVFSSEELCQIEREGLDMRRGKYARYLARVDKGLIDAAMNGDARAAKLVYQRFENWSEKSALDVNVAMSHEEALKELEDDSE